MQKFYFIDSKNGYRIQTNVKNKSVQVGYFERIPFFSGWSHQKTYSPELLERTKEHYFSHQEKPKNRWIETQRNYIHILEQANSFVKDNIDFMMFKTSNNLELSELEIECLNLLMKLKQCDDVFLIATQKFEPIIVEDEEHQISKVYNNIHEKNFYEFLEKNNCLDLYFKKQY